MASLSTPAQRRAVAPPGRKERVDRSFQSMPVSPKRSLAECWRALRMCVFFTLYQRRWEG